MWQALQEAVRQELCETIAGLQKIEKGAVLYNKENIIGKTPKEIINLGISMSFIPEEQTWNGFYRFSWWV